MTRLPWTCVGPALSRLLLILPAVVTLGMAYAQEHSVKPAAGLVPDEATATAIAEAVSIPIYGREKINSEKPLRAILREGVWTVTGTLAPPNVVGGVLIVEISQQDGRVLRVSHGK